ncbi:hypothetical protein C8Q76DRAFT_175176 [Earliella scabrosa]|nr:hypothetical protein C8Q76DRAFT_175176 [Earliella scabrosa]
MVFVGDKKYACETCIKGHRSSSCKHTDRSLFEIKKKGRPVTQCEHCRELRKTRQIHVKCVCESKDSGEGTSFEGGTKLPARAAFPSGLPEELLEASVASQPFSEGSDSDHSNRGCSCKDNATCTCWTPRSRAKRPARAPERRSLDTGPTPSSSSDPISQPAALVVHAHSGNNRPVLPKPPERPASPPRTLHEPSSVQGGRLPSHGQSFYSPYGRAYEYTHGPTYPSMNDPSRSPPNLQQILNNTPSPNSLGAWSMGDSSYPTPVSPPVCGCGPSCACPGCFEHQGPRADPAAACVNPATCLSCLDCNLNTLSALAGDPTRAMYDPSQVQNIDDWLRQVSSMPDLPSSSMQPSLFPPSTSQSQPDLRYTPSIAQPYGLWSDPRSTQLPSQYSPTIPEECCGGRCQCPSGLCACPPDCCGCCQGCQCVGCVHDSGSGRTLTFATSGERAPCCSGAGRAPRSDARVSSASLAGPSGHRPSFSAASGSQPGRSSGWLAPTLTVPRTPVSRASSSSSKSSPHPASASSPVPFGEQSEMVARPGPADPAVGSCCSSMGNLSTGPSNVPSGSRRRGSDQNEYRTSGSQYARPF